MKNRIAIVDLGTNTFHLMVTEGPQPVYEERRPVRIGMGGINRGMITPEALQRALSCLTDYRQKAESLGVQAIYAIGTSALRNAQNVAEVIQAIRLYTGIHVQVISGDQEATLIYDGIRSGMDLGDSTSMIVDIGGGSVEFIIANPSGILWKQSVETGGQRLIELFHHHDPITDREIQLIRDHLDQALEDVFEATRLHQPTVLIGSSGSFDTLSEIWCLKNNQSYVLGPETPLSIEAFVQILPEIFLKDRAERMQIPGMIELRVDMIVVACVLIDHLLKKCAFDSLRVSGYSLKEGVRWRLLQGLSL
ncbi:MAG: hypothetical protein RL161_336 [Bacteroidota bacterium]